MTKIVSTLTERNPTPEALRNPRVPFTATPSQAGPPPPPVTLDVDTAVVGSAKRLSALVQPALEGVVAWRQVRREAGRLAC